MTTAFRTRGFSNEAQYVEKEFSNERGRSQLLNAFGVDSSLREELALVWNECRESNWDGFEAAPVLQATLRNTYQFLESMPSDIPEPSISAEPDGDLTLEWHRSACHTLLVSVNPYGDLHFSARLGSSCDYGTEPFFGDIPMNILELIRQVYAE